MIVETKALLFLVLLLGQLLGVLGTLGVQYILRLFAKAEREKRAKERI